MEAATGKKLSYLVRLSNRDYVIDTSDALGATLARKCLYHLRTNAPLHLDVQAQSISQVYAVNFAIKVCLENVNFRAYLGDYE
jgi:hypothetical protein